MIRIGRCRARAASGEADVPLRSVAMNARCHLEHHRTRRRKLPKNNLARHSATESPFAVSNTGENSIVVNYFKASFQVPGHQELCKRNEPSFRVPIGRLQWLHIGFDRQIILIRDLFNALDQSMTRAWNLGDKHIKRHSLGILTSSESNFC
jgi:hypothetical protein